MEYVVICAVAFAAAGLTLFSGFGLGTILTPFFALFFPVAVAVAATAVVHLLNNLFKLFLVGRHADRRAVVRFALPAALAALAGALLLNYVAAAPPLTAYRLGGGLHEVTAVKLVIGLLIAAFSLLELLPAFQRLALPEKYLPLGGLLSGFFGGLSGNQGAFRAAFLIKAGLSKEAFIGTSVVAAVIVDAVRLAVYGAGFSAGNFAAVRGTGGIVAAATASAFAGSFIAARLLGKVTYRSLRLIVAVLLVVVGLGLAAGLF